MRWASPPERDSAERPSVRYSRPTSLRNRSRSRTSLRMGAAISGSSPGLPLFRTGTFSKKLIVSALDLGDDSFPVRAGDVGPAPPFAACTIEKLLLCLGPKLSPRSVEVETKLLG